MPQPNDLSRSLVALDQNSTIIAVIGRASPPTLHEWRLGRLGVLGHLVFRADRWTCSSTTYC
jgi:hypothetical protein